MVIKRHSGSNVSPSLVSKVKHALELKRSMPKNDKVCSRILWNELVEIIGTAMDCSPDTIDRAKSKYTFYMEHIFAHY